MRTTRFWTCASLVATAALLSTGVASADDISGLITTTRTITANSRLVGDVTCRVTGAPCILVGNPPIQQSTGVPGTAGVDIWDQSAPGATSFDKNICVTAINAPCPNLAPSQVPRKPGL